ncbi:MAG: nucleotidyltransferase family protein [SAR324 cluster bacterium]|nr:nucleotidyltransferase family protein [SAR324 cluster bacterium]
MVLKIESNAPKIEQFCKEHHILYLGLFGSYARGEQSAQSDIDLLVEFAENIRLSLLDVVGIEQELSELLNIPVDLVEKRALKKPITPYVMKDLQTLYSQTIS